MQTDWEGKTKKWLVSGLRSGLAAAGLLTLPRLMKRMNSGSPSSFYHGTPGMAGEAYGVQMVTEISEIADEQKAMNPIRQDQHPPQSSTSAHPSVYRLYSTPWSYHPPFPAVKSLNRLAQPPVGLACHG